MAKFSAHVVGCGRGGTSLLMGLLDAHPDCEMLSEKHSTHHLMGGGDSLGDDLLSLEGRTRKRISAFLQACAQDASQSAAPHWGHKTTTEHVFGLYEPFTRFEEEFAPERHFVEATADVPTVFIVRDGRSCVPSKMRRAGRSLELSIIRWQFSIRLLEQYRRRHPNFIEIKFEDLVTAPEDALRQVCSFVGMPYTAAMLAGTDNPKMPLDYRRKDLAAEKAAAPAKPSWIGLIERDLVSAGYLTG